MTEAAAVDEPTVDEVLARRHGRCSKCDQSGGYRRTLLCRQHYDELIYRHPVKEPNSTAARKKRTVTKLKKKPPVLSAEADRRRLAAMIVREVKRQAPERAVNVHGRLGFSGQSQRYREARALAVENGWIVLDVNGYRVGPVEAPSPTEALRERQAAKKAERKARLERTVGPTKTTQADALKRLREQREVAIAGLADRIAAYVSEHGPAKADVIAAALDENTQSMRWKRAAKLLRERGVNAFDAKGAEIARLTAAIPALLAERGGPMTASAMAEQLSARRDHVREAGQTLVQRGLLASKAGKGFSRASPGVPD